MRNWPLKRLHSSSHKMLIFSSGTGFGIIGNVAAAGYLSRNCSRYHECDGCR